MGEPGSNPKGNWREKRTYMHLLRFRLACLLDLRGCHEEAEVLCRESLVVDLRLYGTVTDHGDIAETRRKLGDIVLKMDRFEEAEQLYRSSFEMRYRLDGEKAGTSEQSRALYNLARKASQLRLFESAKRLYHECLVSIRRMHVMGLHVNIAIVLLHWQEFYLRLGKHAKLKSGFATIWSPL